MKKIIFLLVGTFVISFMSSFNEGAMTPSYDLKNAKQDTTSRDTLLRFEANPSEGFNFPYYVFIPKGTKTGKQFLLVEPNNNGNNDSIQYHDRTSKKAATGQSLGYSIARRLKVPYLVPVFPRPQTEWKIYTHALDRDVMLIKEGPMKRLDLQLIGMIKSTTKNLKELNFALNKKVLLNGFSASGTFVNRFTMVHPEQVAAVAAGGVNAILILSVKEIKGDKMDYPLGINDVPQLFGKPVILDSVKKVRQFLYMGENDTNDAALFDDAYSAKEQKKIFKHLGKTMQPDRWNTCMKYYEAAGMNVEFKTYKGVGHATTREMNGEIAAFFRKVIEEQK